MVEIIKKVKGYSDYRLLLKKIGIKKISNQSSSDTSVYVFNQKRILSISKKDKFKTINTFKYTHSLGNVNCSIDYREVSFHLEPNKKIYFTLSEVRDNNIINFLDIIYYPTTEIISIHYQVSDKPVFIEIFDNIFKKFLSKEYFEEFEKDLCVCPKCGVTYNRIFGPIINNSCPGCSTKKISYWEDEDLEPYNLMI